MSKILLYYKYVDIQYPQQIVKWQKEICSQLGLTGRILVATEGINGTVGGSDEATETYKKLMLEHPLFGGIDFKESAGGAENFPRLRCAVRNEIVTLGVDPQQLTVKDTGIHLKPAEVHELLNSKPDNLIILDTRNHYESRIGKFRDAVIPPIQNFRDFPAYVEAHLDEYKDKEVLMYCTGGVRCERATAYLNQKGIAKKVYQIEGGIHRYIEQFPEGHFRGKNYVFDSRVGVKVNDDILSTCDTCQTACDDYTNCVNLLCHKHIISCADCRTKFNNTCSSACAEKVALNSVPVEKAFKTSCATACNE